MMIYEVHVEHTKEVIKILVGEDSLGSRKVTSLGSRDPYE